MNTDYLLMLLKTMVNDEVIAVTEVKDNTLTLYFNDGTFRRITVT